MALTLSRILLPGLIPDLPAEFRLSCDAGSQACGEAVPVSSEGHQGCAHLDPLRGHLVQSVRGLKVGIWLSFIPQCLWLLLSLMSTP